MTSQSKESNIPRRTFCNRLVLTSAGLALVAGDLKGQQSGQHRASLAYPPVKIEGAERVLPGSFLYFNFPRANDPAVWYAARTANTSPIAGSAPTWDARRLR